jgi:hypothetical protein
MKKKTRGCITSSQSGLIGLVLANGETINNFAWFSKTVLRKYCMIIIQVHEPFGNYRSYCNDLDKIRSKNNSNPLIEKLNVQQGAGLVQRVFMSEENMERVFCEILDLLLHLYFERDQHWIKVVRIV